MKLLVRINLALLGAFVLAALAFGYASERILERDARDGLIREAALMMASASATREYTTEEILPLLTRAMDTAFLPQSVPYYAATQNFLKLHQLHPEYAYKEATLNPTNPRDRAMDWEADLIQQFRNAAQPTTLVGERDTPTGRSLYYARPIRVEGECAACHNTPQVAPASLVARYGSNNGFGWQPGEIIGAQVVSVPLAGAASAARHTWRAMLTALVILFAALLVVANGILYAFVLRPIGRIVRVADALSQGHDAAGSFPEVRTEIGALARSFNRLRISLEKSLKLLER
jgi:HAMP domain-containing protein